jgi:hypothetical protein
MAGHLHLVEPRIYAARVIRNATLQWVGRQLRALPAKSGCECAQDEQRGSEKQSSCGEDAVHPAGKDDAKEAVDCEAECDADGGGAD